MSDRIVSALLQCSRPHPVTPLGHDTEGGALAGTSLNHYKETHPHTTDTPMNTRWWHMVPVISENLVSWVHIKGSCSRHKYMYVRRSMVDTGSGLSYQWVLPILSSFFTITCTLWFEVYVNVYKHTLLMRIHNMFRTEVSRVEEGKRIGTHHIWRIVSKNNTHPRWSRQERAYT